MIRINHCWEIYLIERQAVQAAHHDDLSGFEVFPDHVKIILFDLAPVARNNFAVRDDEDIEASLVAKRVSFILVKDDKALLSRILKVFLAGRAVFGIDLIDEFKGSKAGFTTNSHLWVAVNLHLTMDKFFLEKN